MTFLSEEFSFYLNLKLLDFESQGLRNWDRTLFGGMGPGLSILLEHFQKLHILAATQQKAPRDFLFSFIAGGRKEIKGFGPVSLRAWYNFVQCAEANLVFSMD